MRVIQNIRRVTVVGATVIALGGIGMGAALADPPAGTTPTLTSIVGVGSDTITPLFSGSPTENTAGSLVTDYNATSPASKLWSWDAVNPSTGAAGDTIITKGSSSSDTTCSIARPNGSSAGITALNLNKLDGSDYCIDYARSSRAPNTTTTNDAFVSLAKDAIAWSYPVVSGQTNHQPASLSLAQLTAIYNCTDKTWGSVNGKGAGDTTPIVPVMPQAGSGTRSTWLLALGLPSNSTKTNFPCWVDGADSSGNAIEENTGLSTGNVNQFTGATAAEDIFPFSIGDWIAQGSAIKGTGASGTTGAATVGGHASSIWGHGNLTLGAVPNTLNVVEQPVITNSSSQPVINTAWNTHLNRTLYAVVRNGGSASAPAFPTTPSYEATALPKIFGSTGWICANNTGQSDLVGYGFTSLGGNCGTLTAGD